MKTKTLLDNVSGVKSAIISMNPLEPVFALLIKADNFGTGILVEGSLDGTTFAPLHDLFTVSMVHHMRGGCSIIRASTPSGAINATVQIAASSGEIT